MTKIVRPTPRVITVDEFQAMVEHSRTEKINAGMKGANTELKSPDMGRGMKTTITTTDGDVDLDVLNGLTNRGDL